MINTTIPTTLDFPNRGALERDAFVLAQETAQDLLAGGYTTALNQYAVELNTTQIEINTKAEQVANQAVDGGYSQTYINATFTPKILNTQTDKVTPVDADLIPLSDSASSFGLKKLSWLNIKNTIISSFGELINGLTAKATPIDADMIVIADSASSNASKKLTFANLKAFVAPSISSESTSGIIEIATTSEAQAGTDDLRAITPLKLKNSVLGLGQTWQNMTLSRSLGITYTNSTGKPIFISATVKGVGVGTTEAMGYVDGVKACNSWASYGSAGTATGSSVEFIVPNGSTYYVNGSGSASYSLHYWAELR